MLKRLLTLIGMLLFSAGAWAQTPLNISQYQWDRAFGSTEIWQSFTVSQTSTMSTFGFMWNGGAGDTNSAALFRLLKGTGTAGTAIASAYSTFKEIHDNPIPAVNDLIWISADFGSQVLAPGQYSVVATRANNTMYILGTTSVYDGGQADAGMNSDYAFSTPAPVPEPSMAGMALLLAGGFVLRHRRARTA